MVKLKAILPKMFRADDVIKTAQKETAKYGQYIKADLERLTAKWTGDKPEWVLIITISADGMILEVKPRSSDDEGSLKFLWIDRGTKAHDIYPVNADRLRFQTPYTAGSSPNSLFTIRASTGDQVVYANHVRHPGTKARNWSALVAKNHEKPFTRWVNAAVSKALRDTGHSMTGR